MRTLNTLRLCGNNITKPPREALGALQSLQNLYLNRNQLTQLKKDAFGTLPVVSKLELSGNKLWNVSYSAFENMRQMVSVDLSFNNLSWVPPGAFLGTIFCQSKSCFLHLIYILIKSGPILIKSSPYFHFFIPSFTKFFLLLVYFVTSLVLLKYGFFLGLVALREINLSHNRLRTLQNRTHGLFEDCLSIRKVRLSKTLILRHRWNFPILP